MGLREGVRGRRGEGGWWMWWWVKVWWRRKVWGWGVLRVGLSGGRCVVRVKVGSEGKW